MSLLSLGNVSKTFGGDLILQDVALRVEDREHVALVGSNGAGKSTLLKIMAGLIEPDGGQVAVARGTKVVYLAQEPKFKPDHALYDVVLEVFADVVAAQKRLRSLEDAMAGGHASEDLVEEYGRLQSLVEQVGYDYRQRVGRVLEGLELSKELWDVRVDKLSGGQRTRVNLARTLLEEADLLLLDEPSNHLDIPALEWLESYLLELPRAFVVVAHDRYLLDRVTTRTIDLSLRHTAEYPASYGKYLELKAERQERQLHEYEAQQEEIAKTEEFIRKYGAGQRSKEARGRQKRLDRLERVERPQEEDTVRLRLAAPKRSGRIVLTIEDLVVGFQERRLLEIPDEIVVSRGEKIAIIGPNGSGKTSFLRTLVGEIRPLQGSSRWGSNVTVGYYSQTLAKLDPSLTPLSEVQRSKPMTEEEARSYLGRFLFSGDDAFKTVSMLSGGEKSRVALAKLILEAPNVLILDEPTNHLDIASREALQAVLHEFAGTLIFVSHDRYLLDQLAEQLWVVAAGGLKRFSGNYSDYSSGRAHPVDRLAIQPEPKPRVEREWTLDELEGEAERLAGNLVDIATIGKLDSLMGATEQYAEILAQIQDGNDEWLTQTRAALRSSSD